MRRGFRLLWNILKDESGLWNFGSTIFSGLADKKAQEERGDIPQIQNWQNTDQIKTALSGQILGALNGKSNYKYNPAFETAQPEVEAAAQKNILGYLNNPTSNVGDYGEATKKYSDAMKASMAETYAKEMDDTKNMYNRLGLVSSTPGLTAQGDVSRKQATESNLFDSQLMYQNLDRQLQAQGMDVNQMNDYLNQAQVLGQNQRGYQQNAINLSLADQQQVENLAMQYLQAGAASPAEAYQAALEEWAQPNKYDRISAMWNAQSGF
jgi:hypothetical protein